MRRPVRRFGAKLRPAFALPPVAAYRVVLAELAWSIPLMAGAMAFGGLLDWDPRLDCDILVFALVALFAPALGEELLFRVFLLPKPQPDQPIPALPIALSTGAFVLWHPLQAVVLGGPLASTFLNAGFLVAAGVLGIASSRIYWRTGSIYPAAAFHWAIVMGWKVLLDGPLR